VHYGIKIPKQKDIANLREENRELNEKYIDVLTELRSLK
jgi:hypothetical protein